MAWKVISDEPLVRSAEYPVHGWHGRTTVLSGPAGDLAVYNPGATIAPALRAELRRRGSVQTLIVPNHFHHLGVDTWLQEFPHALVVASTWAIPRLHDRGVEASGYDGIALPGGARFLEIPGTKSGELWLSLATRRGRCWIVGDAFFHLARLPRHPVAAVLWLTGTAPGLRVGSTFRRLALRDRPSYLAGLEEALAAEQPELLVPAHGEELRDPALSARLLGLARARLRG